MRNTKMIRNRPKIKSEEILLKRDFSAVLKASQAVQYAPWYKLLLEKSFFKNPFLISISVATLVTVGVLINTKINDFFSDSRDISRSCPVGIGPLITMRELPEPNYSSESSEQELYGMLAHLVFDSCFNPWVIMDQGYRERMVPHFEALIPLLDEAARPFAADVFKGLQSSRACFSNRGA